MFKLHFETDNDAFVETDTARREEIARILREIADRVMDRFNAGTNIQDINGNTIGEWSDDEA